MKLIFSSVPVLMYYFFRIVNFPTYKSIKANNIKIESIPNLKTLLTDPLSAIKNWVNIDEVYIQYVKSERDENVIKCKGHPFIHAVHLAFAYHVPLTISPDMIWYLISTGASIHIKLNAERLRKTFVNHTGKVEIEIIRNNFIFNSTKNAWDGVVSEIVEHMQNLTNNNVIDVMIANFSTTSNISLTVSQMVIMDSMQKYFNYRLSTMCGIPEIRLAGTKQDWELVKSKANEVLKLIPELDIWINGSLNEILDQFIRAFDDEIDKKFWNSIYKGYLY